MCPRCLFFCHILQAESRFFTLAFTFPLNWNVTVATERLSFIEVIFYRFTLLPLINCWPLCMYCFTWNNPASSFFFPISPCSFAAHPLPLSFQSFLPAMVHFLHPSSHPVSAGPVSPSPLCVMWWHLFATQAAGCLLLCSVIWLLPFSEWGHSLGQQSTDRTRQHTCRNARDSSVQFTSIRTETKCLTFNFFIFIFSSFSSHVCVDSRHIMDLSLFPITLGCCRNICSHNNKPRRNVPKELHSHPADILVVSEVD